MGRSAAHPFLPEHPSGVLDIPTSNLEDIQAAGLVPRWWESSGFHMAIARLRALVAKHKALRPGPGTLPGGDRRVEAVQNRIITAMFGEYGPYRLALSVATRLQSERTAVEALATLHAIRETI